MNLAFRAGKDRSKSTGFCVLILSAFSLSLLSSAAAAADFAHAQKVYVPPSSYDRRIDFSSIREQYTTPSSSHKSSSKTAAKPGSSGPSKSKTTSTASKAGAAAKTAAVPKSTSAAALPASKTILNSTSPPPPALNGKIASGSSLSEIAKSLSAKLPPGALAKMKEAALNLQKSGKLEEAQRLFTKLTQMDPADKAAVQQAASLGVERAKNYLKSDNFQEALQAARQALAVSPNDPEAHQLLAQLYKKVGADPNDVHNRLKTAKALMDQSRYQEAEVEYKASLAVKPTPEAHIGIGKIHEQMHGAGAGKENFEKALELDSNHSSAHRELGLLHLNKGDVVTANSELSRALILDPSDKEASGNLIKLWQTQVSRMPNANSHLGLARAYQLSGDLHSAQAEYREVVRLDPGHPYLPAARQSFKIALAKQEADKAMAAAKNLESQGLIAEAYSKANEAVTYSPGNSSYKLYQGELLEKLGHAAQARQVYLNVLKDDPQNATAVSKIKQLGALAAGAGLSAAGLAQSLVPQGQPAGFPGTKFPGDMLSTASDPVLMSNQGAPIDHVGQLSSFMGQLRNQMLVQKESNQKLEDSTHKVIKSLTNPDEGAAAGAGAAATASASSDDEIIKKILSSPSPKTSTASAAVESGAASALADAAAAIAAAKGAASSKGAASAPAAASSESAAPSQIASKPLSSKTVKKQKTTKISSTEGTTKELVAPPAQALSAAGALPYGTPVPASSAPPAPASIAAGGLPYGTLVPVRSAPPPPPGISGGGLPYGTPMPARSAPPPPASLSAALPYGTPVPVRSAPAPPAGIGSDGVPDSSPLQYGMSGISSAPALFAPGSAMQVNPPAAIAAPLNPVAMATPLNPAAMAAPLNPAAASPAGLRGPISNEPIKFELTQIKPTLSHVLLKVALRNGTGDAVPLPENLRAVIKYPNMTEAEVKISFEAKSIPANGTVDGVVKVPFNKVDPTADLVLRNLLPTPGAELHIKRIAITQNSVGQ